MSRGVLPILEICFVQRVFCSRRERLNLLFRAVCVREIVDFE